MKFPKRTRPVRLSSFALDRTVSVSACTDRQASLSVKPDPTFGESKTDMCSSFEYDFASSPLVLFSAVTFASRCRALVGQTPLRSDEIP